MAAPRTLVLVGNPNVGKSVLFGRLTGKYVTVSNYPGTTVEVTRGSAEIGGVRWHVLDTPGTNNLLPMSEDEQVTRDILLREPEYVCVQVCDAKNLRRGLLLASQLAEAGVAFTLALNMADEAAARGIRIDGPEARPGCSGSTWSPPWRCSAPAFPASSSASPPRGSPPSASATTRPSSRRSAPSIRSCRRGRLSRRSLAADAARRRRLPRLLARPPASPRPTGSGPRGCAARWRRATRSRCGT